MTGSQTSVKIAIPIVIPNQPLRWNTLQWLRASRAAILALDALLLIAVLVSANIHSKALKTIGVDSAPSVIAAQQIKYALADMDADAANELLMPAAAAAGANSAADAPYELRRKDAATALIKAAQNITYGDAELQPILQVQISLGAYERLIQQARDLHRQKDPAALNAYREAAEVMDTRILPAADALDDANNEELENAYRGQSLRSTAGRVFVMLTGLMSVMVLIASQVFLSRRTRRTFNPLLLAATLLAFGFTTYALSAFETEHHQLKIAREDAFPSIHALLRARAVAYQANGLESRSLLDPTNADVLQRAFYADADRVGHPPDGIQPAEAITALRHGGRVEGFTGLLADELNNITFDGEQEAAFKSLSTWETYLGVDAELRRLARAAKTQEAIAKCIGTAPGDSDYAFDQFDKALAATETLNEDAFKHAVAAGFSALDHLDIKASIAAALIALLSFLGLQPRLREYQ